MKRYGVWCSLQWLWLLMSCHTLAPHGKGTPKCKANLFVCTMFRYEWSNLYGWPNLPGCRTDLIVAFFSNLSCLISISISSCVVNKRKNLGNGMQKHLGRCFFLSVKYHSLFSPPLSLCDLGCIHSQRNECLCTNSNSNLAFHLQFWCALHVIQQFVEKFRAF